MILAEARDWRPLTTAANGAGAAIGSSTDFPKHLASGTAVLRLERDARQPAKARHRPDRRCRTALS
jgi:hypothetical protein